MLLVQNLLDGQEPDPAGSLVERGAFLLRVVVLAEGDEEAALAAVLAFALHDGLEAVDVGAADVVGLLHLDGTSHRRMRFKGDGDAVDHGRLAIVTRANRKTASKCASGLAAARQRKKYVFYNRRLKGFSSQGTCIFAHIAMCAPAVTPPSDTR